jgi:acetyl esterase/lipase
VLLDDSRRLAEAQGAGVEVQIDVVPGAQHCFPLSAGRASEADNGIRRWSDWLRLKFMRSNDSLCERVVVSLGPQADVDQPSLTVLI